MSTTTVSFSSTTLDVELEALRRQEAAAREANRQRVGIANAAITRQEARFQTAVTRLDEAARRLPDLALTAPELTAMSREAAEDPARLETYAAQLTAEVDRFSRQLDAAVAEAERLLDRRIKKAAAWRSAADLAQQLDILAQGCRDEAARLGEHFACPAAPARPGNEAELESVEIYVALLQQQLAELKRQDQGLRARIAAREQAVALCGSKVATRSADKALSQHAAEQKSRAVTALRAHRDTELNRHGLPLAKLPDAVQAQLDNALEQAHIHDWRESVTRWIAREKQQGDGIARALELLQCAPDLIHANHALSQRWMSLTAQLQRIAGGLDDFHPCVDREYEQLCADARRLVNTAFTKADWVRRMNDEGFEVLDREDGQELIVVDLDHPEIWLEAMPLEAEDGGFGATLELKTDAEALADEVAVTDDICKKLARVANSSAPDIATEAEVIKRKRRIERTRRPLAFRQSL